MFNVAPIEWVGYSASLFIVISLTMTSIWSKCESLPCCYI